ncbi:hypothetical protein HDV57DRAFT_328677 [Trichoderma longibrachiatum]
MLTEGLDRGATPQITANPLQLLLSTTTQRSGRRMSCPARLPRRTPKRSGELAHQPSNGCYDSLDSETPDRLRAAALFAAPAEVAFHSTRCVRRWIFSV